MDASSRLAGLVELWWAASEEFVALLETLDPEEWSAPTDLAGWDVHAVASHIAHVESMLAGIPQQQVDFEVPPHVRGAFGRFMESGVVSRRDVAPLDLIAEIRTATTARHDALVSSPLTDPRAVPPILPPGLTWDVETLFNNRIVDLWMHQQDIRRAVNRPGHLVGATADHTIRRLGCSLGFVVAKRVGAPAGTTVNFAIGEDTVGVLVDDDSRGHLGPAAESPTVSLHLTREDFVLAAGGRRTITPTVSGDIDLAQQILQKLAVTP